MGGVISGSGSLTKLGSGILALSAANSYSGPTLVVGGTLLVNSSQAGSGEVTVQAGATLGGTGVISGPVTIGSAVSGLIVCGPVPTMLK